MTCSESFAYSSKQTVGAVESTETRNLVEEGWFFCVGTKMRQVKMRIRTLQGRLNDNRRTGMKSMEILLDYTARL